MHDTDRVVLGRINGVFGTRGWLKVFSYTRPRDNVLTYPAWCLEREDGWREYAVVATRRQGNGLVASLAGIDDRNAALACVGADIAVPRSALPRAGRDEFYWADLIGLAVVNREGLVLGAVTRLLETGANDVLVVRGERDRLIPFVREVFVLDVDLEDRTIRVDWHPDD